MLGSLCAETIKPNNIQMVCVADGSYVCTFMMNSYRCVFVSSLVFVSYDARCFLATYDTHVHDCTLDSVQIVSLFCLPSLSLFSSQFSAGAPDGVAFRSSARAVPDRPPLLPPSAHGGPAVSVARTLCSREANPGLRLQLSREWGLIHQREAHHLTTHHSTTPLLLIFRRWRNTGTSFRRVLRWRQQFLAFFL